MSTINVLVAVNVGQAIANRTLNNYVFMVDSTGYSGNNGEGTSELQTTCNSGDTVVWQVVSIDPTETLFINGFTGQALQQGMINPGAEQAGYAPNTVWAAHANNTGTQAQYSIGLTLEGNVQMSFDPYLTINAINLR